MKLFLTPIGASAHIFVACLIMEAGKSLNGIVVKKSLKLSFTVTPLVGSAIYSILDSNF